MVETTSQLADQLAPFWEQVINEQALAVASQRRKRQQIARLVDHLSFVAGLKGDRSNLIEE
jgi:hypothetical protein